MIMMMMMMIPSLSFINMPVQFAPRKSLKSAKSNQARARALDPSAHTIRSRAPRARSANQGWSHNKELLLLLLLRQQQ